MRVEEIRQEAEFQKLRGAWNALVCSSASRTIFLTWEWMAAWWSAYGTPGKLRIFAAYDDSGALRGIAPLRDQVGGRYGLEVPVLSFIGDGSADSEYLDFIIEAGFEEAVMTAFDRHWKPQLDRGTTLQLHEIPDASPNLVWLRGFAQQRGAVLTDAQEPCALVRLPRSWDEYVGTLKPRFRTKVRSVLRSLESREDVRFGFCESVEDLERLLPVLYDLHARRWTLDGKPGVFGWDRKRRFYEELSPLLLQNGTLRFSRLEWRGTVLAVQYGFVLDRCYFHLQEGYEPASEHWNLGIGLRAWTIRRFIDEGVSAYDFLGGIGRHKMDWGAEEKHSHRILIAHPKYKSVLYVRGPVWEQRARESLRNFIPRPVLAARAEAISRRQSGGLEPNADGWEQSWLRKGIAQSYFHLGLPALMRPLRARYELATESNGTSHVRWRRRLKSTARILYYHRVNDDGDPFCPATPTSVFEQQMRFIARNYKVVSLTELLGRIETGPRPEPLLAITFDDGYGDNFEQAFPILQRYGLPATIFLTTGTIDTRRPLWFEELAYALRNTARESIDIEMDVPRRFWMRTQAERLRSNSQIFSLLRGLTDQHRQHWLDEIIAQLQPADPSGRRDKMLTWDQVRKMKKCGIEFGGHTVNHPFLSKLTADQALWEVSECKRRIEEELQSRVDYFAYPNGREEDFSPWSKDVVRSAGYRAAVTTIWGVNDRGTDPLELRRGQPWEQGAAMFAYKFDWYQLANQ